MAFLFLRAKMIKASSGKSAVAAAAYQSAQQLRDEKLGMTFQYRHKEEVVFSEVLLPDCAPAAYENRETLWNAVEAKENKANSQYARQFVIALPKEWTQEESIARTRAFIQENFVSEGMAVDWAFHRKEGNPHVHALCTIRGFKQDGSWAQMEKKEYALDEKGQRIPEIDPKTGEQKVRVRNRNGSISTEKIWKRITVQSNPWSSRKFLNDLKRSWVSYCNQYLEKESQIDQRSFHEGSANRVPLLHEGPEARAALQRGVVFDTVKENQERRQINAALSRMEKLIQSAWEMLAVLQKRLEKWRQHNGKRRSVAADAAIGRNGAAADGISSPAARHDDTAGGSRSRQQVTDTAADLEKRINKIKKHYRHH